METLKRKRHPFLILLSVIASSLLSETNAVQVLTSPKVTDWGEWGSWEFCPFGTFATGMQLYSQPPQGVFRDDHGLTGIRLFCNKYGHKEQSHGIKSSMDSTGKWGKSQFCPGFMTGFQLRSEKRRSAFVDDSAGNNLRMFCDHSESSYKEGDGPDFGSWSDKRLCSKHEAVCGIRTQVEKGFSIDLTGLNNVMIKCCDVPHPIQDCVPKTTWEKVVTCEALAEDATDHKCTYDRKLGVSYHQNHAESARLHEAVGYGIPRITTQLQAKFLSVSSPASEEFFREDSKYNWLLSPSYVWEPESQEKAKVTAKKGEKVALYQVRGQCGMLQVWGTRMKKVITDKNSKDAVTFTDFTNENELDYY